VVEVLILAKTPQNNQEKNESDPWIGLFKSYPDLATQSEESDQGYPVYLDHTEGDLAKNVKNIEQLNNNSNIGQTQLSFGEFIQKFRQEHNLKQDGIESEELLEGVRDLSSGSEVIWWVDVFWSIVISYQNLYDLNRIQRLWKNYLNNRSLPKRKTSYLTIKITAVFSFLTRCSSTPSNADSWLKPLR